MSNYSNLETISELSPKDDVAFKRLYGVKGNEGNPVDRIYVISKIYSRKRLTITRHIPQIK